MVPRDKCSVTICGADNADLSNIGFINEIKLGVGIQLCSKGTAQRLNNVRPPSASIHGTQILLPGSGSTRTGISSNANTNNAIQVSDSLVEGATVSLSAQTTAVFFVSNTIIEGNANGTPKCSFVFLMDGTSLDGNCTAP